MFQMEEGVCEVCSHKIDEPVCQRCLLMALASQLEEQGIRDKSKIGFLDNLWNIKNYYFRNTFCIICGNEEVCLCSFCFNSLAKKSLKNFNVSEKEKINLRKALDCVYGRFKFPADFRDEQYKLFLTGQFLNQNK